MRVGMPVESTKTGYASINKNQISGRLDILQTDSVSTDRD